MHTKKDTSTACNNFMYAKEDASTVCNKKKTGQEAKHDLATAYTKKGLHRFFIKRT